MVVVKGVLLLTSLVLLLIPVALLYALNDRSLGFKLGIVVGFMTLFAASLLYTTKARRHEIFVAFAT